jgi:hypothetical protein
LKLFLCLKNHIIQVYSFGNDEKFILNNEVSLNEPILVIEGNKTHLIIASEIRYLLININSMTIQELSLFDNLNFTPSIFSLSQVSNKSLFACLNHSSQILIILIVKDNLTERV